MSHTVRRRNTHKAHHHRRKTHRDAATPQEPAVAATRPTKDYLVTDHAVLRWLERVTGLDVAAAVREEICAEGRGQLIAEVGQGKIHIAGTNATLQVVAGRVVTVKTRGSHA